MSDVPKQSTEITPEEFLKYISTKLVSPDGTSRLAAIQELTGQKFSSPAILRKLEGLALKDKSKSVREAAGLALDTPTHRYIRKRASRLNRKDRQTILNELADLEHQGLLQAEQANVIRQHYDFDLRPAPPEVEAPSTPKLKPIVQSHVQPSTATKSPPTPEPAPVAKTTTAPQRAEPPAPRQPSAPRPSLTQTLLSETSIKIALYLGAFFVVSAAAILAAVVEAARLPILFIATALFAGGALITRKRLPQPSFALFIVFSFLLPTDANVLGDVLNLTGNANSVYWFTVMALMALLWSFGTWFYTSRLFSLAAFVALAASVSRLAELFNAEPEIYLLLLTLASLVGLGGTYILKRWQSTKFSSPLFMLVQIAQLGLNMYALIVVLMRIEDFPSAWNLVSTIFWLLTAGFYALSDLIFPFVLFPWLAAAALYPVPMLFMFIFTTDAPPVAIASWSWGATLALASEALRRMHADKVRRYAFPLLAVSITVIVSAVLIGFVEKTTYGFTLLLGSAILYTVLQILKPRVYVWVTALLFGLGAFFSFFSLPFMERIDIFAGYIFLAASLLTLLPDLFLKPDFSENKSWRWPLRILGTILATLNFSLLLPLTSTDIGHAAIVYGIYAIFFTAYALRFNTSWIGYLGTASAALALTQSLRYFDLDAWLPALTGLAAAYYLGGWLLKSRAGGWSGMMRISGLALGGLVALAATLFPEKAYGWYLLVTGALFTCEMFLRKNGWLEAGPGFYFPAALVLLLQDFEVEPIGYYLLGLSLLWLTLDLVFERTFRDKRPVAWPMRGLGALLVGSNTLYLLFGLDPLRVIWICFGCYSTFFLIYALLKKRPDIGYAFTSFLPLTIWYLLRDLQLDIWVPALTGLAAAYYLGGWLLKSRAGGWSGMLRISGLALGGLVALAAIIFPEKAYGWYLLVTGALFTCEMFLRKNGWLEAGPGFYFPAALVLLLQDFEVEQVGYYLLGLSLLWLTLDLVFERTFRDKRPVSMLMWGLGALLVVSNTLYLVYGMESVRVTWICFGCYSIYFLIYALLRNMPVLGYAFTSFLPLTIWYLLRDLQLDAWLLPMMIPAFLYYLVGFGSSKREKLLPWSDMLRFSGLGLASLIALTGVMTSQEHSGWFALLTALLFVLEMYAFHRDKAEAGIQVFLAIAVTTLLGEANAPQNYQLLGISLALLGTDLVLANTYKGGRAFAWFSRGIGALFVVYNSFEILQGNSQLQVGAVCFGIYMLFILAQALLYRLPALGYGVTLFSVLTVITTLRAFGQSDWLLPVTALVIIFYASGYFLRKRQKENPLRKRTDILSLKWPFVLWTSGLGAGLFATIIAPAHGGLSAAIPVAVTATIVAVEAFDRKNVWLGFPANALYLMAYFVLLVELHQDEPQYFSIATAALGLLMHYLLTRAGSRTGAFITGMVSQLVLLSTTYIQFVSTGRLLFFAVIFFQALAVLVYGIVIRSRSLVITPIVFIVLSVGTVLYGLLEGILPVILIGCTGIILLMLGIFAVILRDRLKQISERFSDWGA